MTAWAGASVNPVVGESTVLWVSNSTVPESDTTRSVRAHIDHHTKRPTPERDRVVAHREPFPTRAVEHGCVPTEGSQFPIVVEPAIWLRALHRGGLVVGPPRGWQPGFSERARTPTCRAGGPRHRRPAAVSTLCHIAADGIRPPVGPDRAVHQAEFFALVQERHTWQAEEHGRQRECSLSAEVVGAEPGGGPVLVEARSHPPD